MRITPSLAAPALAVFTSVWLASCAGGTPPPADPTAGTVSEARDEGVWVWVQQGGRRASALVDPESGRVIRERAGIWVVSGFGLAELRVRETRSRTFECADLEAGVDPLPLVGSSPTHLLELCVEGEESCRTLVPPIADGSTAELHDHIEVKITLGPYLFVHRFVGHFDCGAHGNMNAMALTIDLRDGSVVDLTPHLPEQDELRAIAFDAMRERWGDELGDVEPSALTFEAAWPELQEGRWGLRFLYTLPACYVCGDGGWSSYTVAYEVRSEALGPLLEPYRDVSAGALHYVRSRPGLIYGGASR